MYKNTFKIFIFVSFLIALLFFLTPLVDEYQYSFLSEKGIFEKDILYKVLGETRKILSDSAYTKGDEYLHGGIIAKDKSKCEEIGHVLEYQKDTHEHLHEEDGEATGISKLNILPRLGGIIHISKHIHLHGEEEKELLPWFYYAVRLNPKNIDAYVIGGYWIGKRLNKPDEAIKFLEEGLTHNPDSWQIYTQLGEIYFIIKKDYRQALADLQKSYDLLTEENSDKYDKREVYTFMAASYERLGEIDKAIEFYRKILVLSSYDKSILKKITSLGK